MDFQFGAEKLIWKTYTIVEVLPTTSRVELMDKKEFAQVALRGNFEIFVVHVVALKVPAGLPVHLLQTAQITTLKWNKANIKIWI